MTNPAEFEAGLSAVESRMEQIAADAAAAVSDAAAARHLAAARERDLTVKVDATTRRSTPWRLGVSRVSYGPWSQNVALTALARLTGDVHDGGGLPADTRRLN